MDKKDENVFFLKIVTSSGDSVKSVFCVSPLFYDAQRKQIMELVVANRGKSWKGVVLYIGDSDYRRGAVWQFGTLSNYLITQDDLKDIKTCVYREEYFNGFC